MNIKTTRYYILTRKGYNFKKTKPEGNVENMEKLDLPYPVGGDAKWHSYFGKKFGSFL